MGAHALITQQTRCFFQLVTDLVMNQRTISNIIKVDEKASIAEVSRKFQVPGFSLLLCTFRFFFLRSLLSLKFTLFIRRWCSRISYLKLLCLAYPDAASFQTWFAPSVFNGSATWFLCAAQMSMFEKNMLFNGKNFIKYNDFEKFSLGQW